jgi:hypothetical protein
MYGMEGTKDGKEFLILNSTYSLTVFMLLYIKPTELVLAHNFFFNTTFDYKYVQTHYQKLSCSFKQEEAEENYGVLMMFAVVKCSC